MKHTDNNFEREPHKIMEELEGLRAENAALQKELNSSFTKQQLEEAKALFLIQTNYLKNEIKNQADELKKRELTAVVFYLETRGAKVFRK